MTTTSFKAFILEPFELAVGQPHQVLISSASVSIVALEAATLIPFPANVALAIGAEWAYLRGLISGHGIKTRWAPALNWSAVLLVICYGSLWGFRQFHLIPDTPAPWLAVLLTIIHIGAIGAVTLCSAMLHRVNSDVKALAAKVVAEENEKRNQEKVAAEEERNRRLQLARDELTIEMQRRDAELRLMEETARRKMQLAIERRELRSATNQAQPKRNQPINYNGVEYPTIQAAADAHDITRQAMAKRLRKNT